MNYRIIFGIGLIALLGNSVSLYANGAINTGSASQAASPGMMTSGAVSQSSRAGSQLRLMAVAPAKSSNGDVHSSTQAQQYDPEHLFEKPNDLEQQAFKGLTKKSMPLTPEQILQLKKMLAITQRASAAPVGTSPKPVLSTQIVSLAPGTTPPVIRLQQGFVTSVVFVDSTGAEWPIDAYDLGNSKAFNIQWKKGSNTMMIQAISMYTYGNLAVKLNGLSTPVMLTLVPGQQIVDYRVDLRVQQPGPNAKPEDTKTLPKGAKSILLGVLDAVAPTGSKFLKVSGEDCNAWLLGDKIYLRTRLTLLSPSWLAMMTSPDGMKSYELQKTSTILVSKNGHPIELKIEGL